MIPTHLLPHLNRAGAHIQDHPEGQTVHVPGANHHFLFNTHGEVLSKPLGHEGKWQENLQMTNLSQSPNHTHDAMQWMVNGDTEAHGGRNHRLRASQHWGLVNHDGTRGVVTSVEGLFGGRGYVAASSHTGIDWHGPQLDPTSHQLARSTLETRDQTPGSMLADHFSDHHNVSHLLSPPDRYYRDYAKAIRSLNG